jgi:putative ABC transport system ATP-binding protein
VTGDTIGTVSALRRALQLTPALRQGLWWTVGLAVVGAVGRLVVPVTIQLVIDHQILAPGGVDMRAVVGLGLLAVAVLSSAALANRQAQVRMSTAAARGLCELRVMTFEHLHRLSVLHVEGERRGALVARVTADFQEIQQFRPWGVCNLLLGVLRN